MLKSALLIFALLHLTAVSFGALSLYNKEWLRDSLLGKYAGITGANSGYGFFAPGVGSQLRASFELERADGSPKKVGLERGFSREADLRVGNAIGRFWVEKDNEIFRRALAASLSGKILARYPDFPEVTLVLESFQLPSREEALRGEKGRWKKNYRGTFERAGRKRRGSNS